MSLGAAAKSLQSCLTLCTPIDGSRPVCMATDLLIDIGSTIFSYSIDLILMLFVTFFTTSEILLLLCVGKILWW